MLSSLTSLVSFKLSLPNQGRTIDCFRQWAKRIESEIPRPNGRDEDTDDNNIILSPIDVNMTDA